MVVWSKASTLERIHVEQHRTRVDEDENRYLLRPLE